MSKQGALWLLINFPRGNIYDEVGQKQSPEGHLHFPAEGLKGDGIFG